MLEEGWWQRPLLPRVLCAQGPGNLDTQANTRVPLLGQEAFEPEIGGGKAEEVQQGVLLTLPWFYTLSSQLLLAAS